MTTRGRLTCARCGADITEENAEVCWYCLARLCQECWEAYGHCGHAEATARERRAARTWKRETTRTALAYRGRCHLYDNRPRLARWFYTFKALVCVWLGREFAPTPDDYEYHYGFEDWHDIAALSGDTGWTEFGAGGWVELLRVPAGVLRRWQYIVVQESWP